ncbi:MAG: hypothetical protein J4O03_14980 [Chloroflexi bacterium]|nr:hypothetical protein [Chloroflexota bacterium]
MRFIDRKGIFFIAMLGLLSLIFALAWLSNVPSANAQGANHVFKGKVILDGRPAPDGTRVIAYIDGVRVRSERTNGGTFEFELRQGSSMAGKTVEFRGRTVDGRELRFPQNARLLFSGVTTIDLELRGSSSFPGTDPEESHVFQGPVVIDGRPVPDETRVWANINQVRVSGTRTRAGRFRLNVRQPVSNAGMKVEIWVRGEDRVSFRVPQTWPWQPGGFTDVKIQFGGDAPDASTRLEQERARLEQERILQEGQQALEKQRLEAERGLQQDQARLERERLKQERVRQEEQARLDQERIKREQGLFEQEQKRQRELDQARFEQEQVRIKREQLLAEQQQRVEQERMARLRQQEERDFKAEQERLRREVELNLQRQKFELEQRTRQGLGLPPLPPEKFPPPGDGRAIAPGEIEDKGPRRGFFTNTTVGGLGTANNLMDPTWLAVIGIVLTLGATMLQMIRGN